jgi:hypothetical protein
MDGAAELSNRRDASRTRGHEQFRSPEGIAEQARDDLPHGVPPIQTHAPVLGHRECRCARTTIRRNGRRIRVVRSLRALAMAPFVGQPCAVQQPVAGAVNLRDEVAQALCHRQRGLSEVAEAHALRANVELVPGSGIAHDHHAKDPADVPALIAILIGSVDPLDFYNGRDSSGVGSRPSERTAHEQRGERLEHGLRLELLVHRPVGPG